MPVKQANLYKATFKKETPTNEPPHEKTLLTFIILAFSLPLFAQRQIELKELQSKAAEVIPVKVEMIDNQEVLTVSDDNDTIRIPLTEESKADIDALLNAPMGTSKRLKDINGADVTIMKVFANMKPTLFFRTKTKVSINIGVEVLKQGLQN